MKHPSDSALKLVLPGLTFDSAYKLCLYRLNEATQKTEALEKDVNFFILMLESLGAKTCYSCAGHSNGFYIIFRSSYQLAQRIEAAGYFTVELGNRTNEFVIRLCANERAYENINGKRWGREDKLQCLRWAAESWIEKLTNIKE